MSKIKKSDDREKSALEKALDINLDLQRYGSFAEIGAGQEVARYFFQAGKASQTVALTISAYDMTFSDTIYSKEKSGRYVCESRLDKMLSKEYSKLIDRLSSTRGARTCFFAFSATVATSSEDLAHSSIQKNSHGWIGVKFQQNPNSEPSEVKLHVRLLDKQRLHQQETLGKLGVNLIHSSFYHTQNQTEFLTHLFEQLKEASLSIDTIHFSGEAFKKLDQLSTNLQLIEMGWSDAIYIDADEHVVTPSEALWGKNVFIQRAYYKPVTNTHLDISKRGFTHFQKEFQLKKDESITIFEFTLNNRIKNEVVPLEEAVKKVKMITSLGIPVLVSRFSLFYQLKEFIRLCTKKPLGIVIGATHLSKLFDQNFYSDLSGGLLEGMGKLLDDQTRLYIYPHKTKEICLLTKSFFPEPKMASIYKHFIDNKFIQDIAGCDEIEELVHSEDIIKMIKNKNSNWKKHVPEKIQGIVPSFLK